MLPVIAIIGRPNVGKSTLFNKLTRSRDALVADLPGLTRDRKYGEGVYEDRRFIVIDTGGIDKAESGIDEQMLSQGLKAVEEADVILFVLDARAGLIGADETIANAIRANHKPVFVVLNKSEALSEELSKADFYALGLGEPFAISATHNQNINTLMQSVLSTLPAPETDSLDSEQNGTQVAVIGRPNVGKSTLVNRILGEERVIVFDKAGTTRDSIFIPFEHFNGNKYTLIDTHWNEKAW